MKIYYKNRRQQVIAVDHAPDKDAADIKGMQLFGDNYGTKITAHPVTESDEEKVVFNKSEVAELLRTIVSQGNDNPNIINSAIYNAAKKILE